MLAQTKVSSSQASGSGQTPESVQGWSRQRLLRDWTWDMGEREVKDFSSVTPVFTAGAIAERGKASDKAGLKGGRGVWLDAETPGT